MTKREAFLKFIEEQHGVFEWNKIFDWFEGRRPSDEEIEKAANAYGAAFRKPKISTAADGFIAGVHWRDKMTGKGE